MKITLKLKELEKIIEVLRKHGGLDKLVNKLEMEIIKSRIY